MDTYTIESMNGLNDFYEVRQEYLTKNCTEWGMPNDPNAQKPTGIRSPIAQEIQDKMRGLSAWTPEHPKFYNPWTEKWSDNPVGQIVPIIRTSDIKKCECGSSAVGSSMHSDWCCLYEKA